MTNLGSAELLGLAWSLGWRIAAGLIIGYYADDWLGTSPWLTLLLAIAALIVAVRQMILLLNADPSSRDGETER